MKYIVKSPVSNYNGTSAGVVFKDGSGETDDPRIAEWLQKKGYTVTEEKAAKEEKPKDTAKTGRSTKRGRSKKVETEEGSEENAETVRAE